MSLLKSPALGTHDPLAAKVPEITVIFWIIKVSPRGWARPVRIFSRTPTSSRGSVWRCWPSLACCGCSCGRGVS